MATTEPCRVWTVAEAKARLSEVLRADNCLSRYLFLMGFAVVDSETRLPLAVSLESQL